jgi:hypothetical protein
MITFYQNLYRNALPMVKVNGNLVTIHATGRCKVRCFIGNFVSSEEDFLKIEVGKDSVRTVENPYYMTNCPTLPNWQCKGNIGDRRIVIPKEYFPNANENVVYPFSFYVENRRIAELFGNFIPAEHAIVILIGSRKDMHSSECSGKRCMLRVKYGRGRCILLAEPSILANPMLA